MRGPVRLPLHARLVPFFTAMVAVLAALATLYAHHRSIQSLAARNDALLLTNRATDQYNFYESTQLKATLYQALHKSREYSDEERTSISMYSKARSFEKQADELQAEAVALSASFETLEISVTLFEIAIAFASIAALTGARFTLIVAVCLCAAGFITGIIGFFQVH